MRTDRKWLADTTGRLKRAEGECRVSREFWKRRRTRTTLERSTGTTDVASVPEHRIINGLAELVCGYPLVGQDLADLSVAVPITHQILRKLWPNQAEKYTKYLYKDGSDDLTLMVGIMRGGQQVFDWLVPGSTMVPMGLAMYLSRADIAKSA